MSDDTGMERYVGGLAEPSPLVLKTLAFLVRCELFRDGVDAMRGLALVKELEEEADRRA